MISALFSTEVTALESQVTQLQAQITQAQERISQLGEVESMTAGAVAALRLALDKVTTLAPSAIDSLRQTVMGLFGSDGNDGGQPVSNGGPLPITPAPEPPADTVGEQHAIGHPVVCREQLVASADMEVSDAIPAGGTEHGHEQLFAADEPELNGQCCCLDDAPPESLQGQSCELACLRVSNVVAVYEDSIKQSPTIEEVAVSIAAEDSLFKLIEVTPLLSYMKRNSDGMIAATYIGFNSKSRAKMWSEWLSLTHSVATKTEVRVAKRLSTFKYELKCSGVSFKSIERLAQCDFNKDPRSTFSDAPAIKPERVPTNAEIDDFKAGDVVKNVSIRNWSYTILSVKDDGFLEVERIGVNPPIRSTINPASVELIRRGGVVEIVSQELAEHLEKQAQESIQPPIQKSARIDENDTPGGVRLLHGRDDLLNQFEVLMTVEARVMGRIQRQQKQIGILTEVAGGVEALRPRASVGKVFDRTLDAVAYLIAGSGYKPLPSVKEPVLIGAVSVDDDDF